MKPTSMTRSGVLRCARRGGFTLIEMMVVLSIAALLAAIVFSGFHSMKNGNRRVSCQTNLIAIYQAARQYQADEGAFPYYDPDNTLGTGNAGAGLWQLYAYPDSSTLSGAAVPAAKMGGRYLRNTTVFHCPSHIEAASKSLFLSNGEFNPLYLTYQVEDPGTGTDPDHPVSTGVWTYDTIRTTNSGDNGWKRQILHYDGLKRIDRPPADNTVVTWCPFHRNEGGGYDNILFYDGSIDLGKPETDPARNWLRLPRGDS